MSKPAAIEYDSPFPECRVTATTEPFGMIRLDVSRDMAAYIAKQANAAVEDHDGDGLVDVRFPMDRRAYSHMSENVGRILDTDADGVQVVIGSDPEISIMVILNRSQIQGLDTSTTRDLNRPGDAFMWEISVSENGATMLVDQLVAAIQGADDPMSEVDDE